VETFSQAIPFATLLRNSSPKQLRHIDVTGDDVLILPYSSGTMGLPKGAMLTHRNFTTVNHLQSITALGTDTTDRALLFLPFYHIYGTMLTGSFLACVNYGFDITAMLQESAVPEPWRQDIKIKESIGSVAVTAIPRSP